MEVPGRYRIALRRYPRESNLAIRAKALPWPSDPETHARKKDVRVALNIVEARLMVGEFDESRPVAATDDEIIFDVDLAIGQQRIQTWFTQDNGQSSAAWYTYIEPVVTQHN